MYKVGDKVMVKEHLVGGQYYGGVYFTDDMEMSIRKVFKIENIFNEDDVKCYVLDDAGSWHWSDSMFEKVEESKEMTFPEMVQKLIDGEFEVGTELVREDEVNSYFVDKLHIDDSYGLTKSLDSISVLANVGAIDLNKKWEVKEEPIKEMSIEEVQKELGYKIKIVER